MCVLVCVHENLEMEGLSTCNEDTAVGISHHHYNQTHLVCVRVWKKGDVG